MAGPDFQVMLDRVKRRLAAAIVGRETSTDWVDPSASQGRKEFLRLNQVPVNTKDGMIDFMFSVHSDCTCEAINSFITTVNLANLTVADGPRGGKILAIDKTEIAKLFIYKK